MANERFTAWLSPGEYAALERKAAALGCSKNYIARWALRALLLGEKPPEELSKGTENETVNGTR